MPTAGVAGGNGGGSCFSLAAGFGQRYFSAILCTAALGTKLSPAIKCVSGYTLSSVRFVGLDALGTANYQLATTRGFAAGGDTGVDVNDITNHCPHQCVRLGQCT